MDASVDRAAFGIDARHHETLLVVHLRRESITARAAIGQHRRAQVEGVHDREVRR